MDFGNTGDICFKNYKQKYFEQLLYEFLEYHEYQRIYNKGGATSRRRPNFFEIVISCEATKNIKRCCLEHEMSL